MKPWANLEIYGWKKAGGDDWETEGMQSTISGSQFMAEFEYLLEKTTWFCRSYKKLKQKA